MNNFRDDDAHNLSLSSKQMMEKHKTLLIKMALGSPTNEQEKLNYKHIYDL
jgi:hypothetical protein